MDFIRYVRKQKTIISVTVALSLSMTAIAQEVRQERASRQEVTVQGAGFLMNESDGNGIENRATDSGGILIGHRYSINRWLAAEGDFGLARNTQIFSGSMPARVQANVRQFTGSAVVKLPSFAKLQPFLLAGGGALMFSPTGNAGGTFAGAERDTIGSFLYGGGADYSIAKHWSLRVQYRRFAYKAPDFHIANLNTNTWTQVAQPTAGIVFRF